MYICLVCWILIDEVRPETELNTATGIDRRFAYHISYVYESIKFV
jgi:hypothetical protein